MKPGRFFALVYFISLIIALILVSFIGKAKATTLTWNQYMTEDRNALTFGWGDELNFELGVENTQVEEEDDKTYQHFGLSLALNYRYELKTDENYWAPRFSFGAGVGFLLEAVWETTKYDVIGYEIKYPSVEADTYIYAQALATVQVGVMYGTIHVRYGGLGCQVSLGAGVSF